MEFKRFVTVVIATGTLFAAFSMQALAVVIIDGTTPGFYNTGLGDLSTDSVLGAQTDTTTGFNLFPAANGSSGDPIILPVASEPNLGGADAGTQAALGNFLGNTTVLGGNWSATSQAIPAAWTNNEETAIVYEIDAGAGFSSLTLDFGVDNGVFIWFDGVYQFGATAPGGAFASEYSLNLGAVSGGTHFLQVLRADHGGARDWIISADATAVDPTVRAVPEPVTAALGLMGLGVLGMATRRRVV